MHNSLRPRNACHAWRLCFEAAIDVAVRAGRKLELRQEYLDSNDLVLVGRTDDRSASSATSLDPLGLPVLSSTARTATACIQCTKWLEVHAQPLSKDVDIGWLEAIESSTRRTRCASGQRLYHRQRGSARGQHSQDPEVLKLDTRDCCVLDRHT